MLGDKQKSLYILPDLIIKVGKLTALFSKMNTSCFVLQMFLLAPNTPNLAFKVSNKDVFSKPLLFIFIRKLCVYILMCMFISYR